MAQDFEWVHDVDNNTTRKNGVNKSAHVLKFDMRRCQIHDRKLNNDLYKST